MTDPAARSAVPVESAVSIRRAVPSDAGVLTAFARRTFTETYAPDNRPQDVAAYVDASFGEEIQKAEMADPRVAYLLAEVDGVLAGYVQLRDAPPPNGIAVDGPMEIARFYVGADWHGRGVAGALMRAGEAHAAGCGARSLWLCVWRRNARAIRFYQKCGFGVVGEMEFTMGSDVQMDHVMAREVA
jgi:ribosomal protein S18 acetylase RimI-like enzyme